MRPAALLPVSHAAMAGRGPRRPGHRIPGGARPGGAGRPTKWGGSAVADADAPESPLTGRHSRSAWHETAANADASVRNNPESSVR